jgi:hypothetical protein
MELVGQFTPPAEFFKQELSLGAFPHIVTTFENYYFHFLSISPIYLDTSSSI